jgi:AcrR family transcriptional regulator
LSKNAVEAAPSAHAPPLAPKQERSASTRRHLLDAAVQELVERGYGNFTSSAVALRAGVSRGAQQHHFPHKIVLVTEAVRHLAQLQLADLRTAAQRTTRGRARVERALELLFSQYNGPLFSAILELSLAARSDDGLRTVVAEAEREISKAIAASAAEVCGPEVSARPGFSDHWAMALSAIRGLAMLRLLGHPEHSVEQQWRTTRRTLVRLLLDERGS